MARGRKPKPTHLKLITGNPGRRALNTKEPSPPSALPSPPTHLNDEAKVEWDRVAEDLYRIGILTNIDRAVLAAYCQAYGRWVSAELVLADMAKNDEVTRGLTVETINGNILQNPMVGMANKAMADMVRYAAEFGMTPSARSRINTDALVLKRTVDPADKYFS